MTHKTSYKRFICLLAATLMCCSSCLAKPPWTDSVSQSAAEPSDRNSQASVETEYVPYLPLGIGSGVVTDGDSLLNEQQLTLITDYMYCFYDSLATFEIKDPLCLFAAAAQSQLIINRTVWEYMIGIRQMQRTDLKLAGYEFRLSIQQAEQETDGELSVTATEYSAQNFAAHPSVDSESFDVIHHFSLRLTDAGWRITGHTQRDTLYWSVIEQYYTGRAELGETPVEQYFEDVKLSLLEQARAGVTQRLTRGTAQTVSCDNEYDRSAAVAYSARWVGARNGDWPDYTGSGGNCQNYVSQCLIAGSIPMDITVPAIWKWYGSGSDNRANASGRSPSWSGVDSFLNYVTSNSGFGLRACADIPYYSAKPADLLIVGSADDWKHIVIIASAVTDANGETVDYLVNSNTADLKNFPASAYYYTYQMAVSINGWNS